MYTIAIDLGGTVVKIGLLSDGEIVDCVRLPSRLALGLALNLPKIKEAIDRLLAAWRIDVAALRCIGLAFPGLVDPIHNRVISTNEKYDDAFQFIRDVACDWDDSKYLEAEPAKYITVARKAKGTDNWFVGGKTDAARTAVVKLDFLDKGKKYACAIYQDGKNADYEKNPKSYKIVHKTVKKGDVLKINEARGGGFAISLLAK